MLRKADTVDEIQVGGEDFFGRVAREHADEHRDDAFHDYRVGISRQYHFALGIEFGIHPYAALASLDKVLGGLELFGYGGQFVAEVDDIGVAVHPVVEIAHFGDYFVLLFVDGHCFTVFYGVYVRAL